MDKYEIFKEKMKDLRRDAEAADINFMACCQADDDFDGMSCVARCSKRGLTMFILNLLHEHFDTADIAMIVGLVLNEKAEKESATKD